MRHREALVCACLIVAGCDTGSKAAPEPAASAAAPVAPSPAKAEASGSSGPAAQPEGALRLGAPIEASAQAAKLADVAKEPSAYLGKTFATTGTVTSVCQHMGCWMEIKDEASEAHVKMAGHAFFVPKTASGRKARVLAKLVQAEQGKGSCAEDDHAETAPAGHGGKKGCRAEAEAQLGHPLAKLELVAEGVELM